MMRKSLSFAFLSINLMFVSSLSLNNNKFHTSTNIKNVNAPMKEALTGTLSKIATMALLYTATIPSQALAVSSTISPVYGGNDIMKPKTHGTSEIPVQSKLRFGCDVKLADRICNYNRNWAEFAGYWTTTTFLTEVDKTKEITFYDSVTGKPLFVAPRGRSFEDWKAESLVHGWPSFRDEEVVWDNVRILKDGETVSVTGTHLGHNLPDRRNRYCINLVSIAGYPSEL